MQSLLRQKKAHITEGLIKESLLRQLSYSVKELQLESSQTDEVFKTNEACNSLIIVLEAIFLHGLKKGILQTALKTVGGADEAKPEPSFWAMVRSYTHKDTVNTIKKLSQINTDVGRCRVWLRIALNQMEITSYLQAMEKDRRPVNSCYNNFAYLRDREMCDTACKLLEGIVAVQFDIPVNANILNTWNTEPLMMSGVWSPPQKIPLSNATDVAEGIEVDCLDDDTCSIKTSSSITTLSTILALDESQALKIILDAPLKRSDKEANYMPPRPSANYPRGFIPEEDEEKATEGQVNEEEPPDECQSKMGNSLSNTSGWSSSDAEEGKCDGQKSEEGAAEGKVDEVVQPEQPKTFSGLLESYGRSPLEDSNYRSILQKMSENRTAVTPEDSSDFEVFNDKENKYENQLFKVVREKGLKSQNYKCIACQLSIGLNFDEARFCHFTGNYYCSNCHSNETSLIPSRVIYNWDSKPYPVCREASSYLAEIHGQLLIDVKKVNSKLYGVVPELQQLRTLRFRLNLLRAYLSTCREPVIKDFQKRVWPRDYLCDSIHKYTLSDLGKVPGGALASELSAIATFAKEHVLHCWLCSQKGFICEICRNPKVIYPFDCDNTYRCSKCFAVYHEGCLSSYKNCPKCKRLKARTLSSCNADDESEQ